MQKISIPRGTSLSFVVKLRNEAGEPYTLSSGDTLIFGVKRVPEHKSYIFSKTKTSSDYQAIYSGYKFDIAPADTSSLSFGKYVYDISCQKSSGDFYQIMPVSPFIIEESVTEKITSV